MCLVALALGQSARFPLVLASNRDEFFDRPAAGLAWWTPAAGGPALLAGRDLQAGGTWLGLSATGRLALVTNVRAPAALRSDAPSRGELVPRWLQNEQTFEPWWREIGNAGHSGFNLIAADVSRDEWTWASNAGLPPRRLRTGLYGMSNAALDTPWPKTERLKQRLCSALNEAGAEPAEALAARLFDALADRRIAPDAELPDTGIALDRERALSAAFIRTADGRYGTRCSTVVIVEHVEGRSIAHVLERSFDAGANAGAGVDSRPAVLRSAQLLDWPPLPGAVAQPGVVTLETLLPQAGDERMP